MRVAKEERLARFEAKKLIRSKDKLRCPIICILGHVDTGKTKILDNIRRTNVQDGEAGCHSADRRDDIPEASIKERTFPLNKGYLDLNVPGLLVIDTPGHESFTNLRSRGSSLCDLAILVVDIMHGLEPQTLESLNMLRMPKTPFIIGLNKIDRMYDWQSNPNFATRETLDAQKNHARLEYEDRAKKVMLELANEGQMRHILGQPRRAQIHQRGADAGNHRRGYSRSDPHPRGPHPDAHERAAAVLRRGAVHGAGGKDDRGSRYHYGRHPH